VLEKHLVAN